MLRQFAAGSTRVVAFPPAIRRSRRSRRRARGKRVTGQFSAVDGLLTGHENLILMAGLLKFGKKAGRRRAGDLLARFGLAEAATKPASTYSGGMRRRLDLAMTLAGTVIFLDESTTGLDPRSRRTMWGISRGLVSDGVTIFLTTQCLDEADQLADRIGVLDRGRRVAEGASAQLKARISGGHVERTFASAADEVSKCEQGPSG
jgi:ABC-2 type transport system ATP-binding protein